jgi:hypothetical protein
MLFVRAFKLLNPQLYPKNNYPKGTVVRFFLGLRFGNFLSALFVPFLPTPLSQPAYRQSAGSTVFYGYTLFLVGRGWGEGDESA